MKKVLFITFIFLCAITGCSDNQEKTENGKSTEAVKSDTIKSDLTKIERFTSKKGVILKFTDYSLAPLKTRYTTAETRIRKISDNYGFAFFYQIEAKGDYKNITSSIEYLDLIELINALSELKKQVNIDLELNPDYLENKYITTDDFQAGYYISDGKTTWFLKLDKYTSGSTLFINDVDEMESSFLEAKNKIESLQK
jgi:hypothetical protein